MFEFLKRWREKASRTGPIIFRALGDPQWSKRDYKQFADEAYRCNVIAYQAIDKIAKAVAQIPWRLVNQRGEEVAKSPLLELMRQPNPLQSRVEFIQSLVGYYQIAGNSYIEKATNSIGVPLELYPLRPDRMHIIKSETLIPKAFKYKISDSDSIKFEVDTLTGESDILHMKTFNPVNDWYGMSPVEAAAYSIDTHNEASAWVKSLLDNGAAPSGVLESENELTDDQYNRLKNEIDEKYTGSSNAGRPLLAEGGLSWKAMGFSPTDMSIIETKFSSARDISLAFAVPPLLLNIPGDSTYSNYSEARLAFYEETVIPLAEHIVAEFNRWLAKPLKGARFELVLEKVPAMVDKRLHLWEMADKSNDLTINERRKLKGYEPVPDGDTIYIDSNKIPLSFDNIDPPEDGEA